MNRGVDFPELNILEQANVSKRKLQELVTKISANNAEVSATQLQGARHPFLVRRFFS